MPLIPQLLKRLPPPRGAPPKPFRLELSAPRRRGWAGLAGSIALHLLIIGTAALALRHPAREPRLERAETAQPAPPLVQLVPLAPPAPEPEPEPEPPREERPQLIRPPVVAPPTPPIDVEEFPDVVDEVASSGDDGTAPPAEAADASDEESAPAPTELARAPTMEEEARRIFGRPGRRGAGTAEREEWTGPLPGPPNPLTECTIPPFPPTPPGAPTPMSTASGRILADDNRTPLPGAHLQLIGHPYSTFSGSGGQYRLTIPRRLVEDCRVQYVRVSASGYRSRLLPLSLGPAPMSDDVSLSRR